MIGTPSSRRFWQQRSRALAWQINLAAWLARFAPAAFFVGSPFAITWYALRREQVPFGWTGFALPLAWSATALACWWRARPSFFAAADARVLLESQLRLDTRLTAAEARLVPWPAIPPAGTSVVRWRLGAPAGWLAAAAALVLAAVYVPVPTVPVRPRFAGPAPALLQTEAMLSALKQMDIADPAAVQQLSDRASELAQRPAAEQFSHSALEAADALRNQTAAATNELARGLDDAARALQPNAENGQPDMRAEAGQLAAALSGLRDGSLPANKQLLSHLPATSAALQGLSAQQRAGLANQLAGAAKGLRGISGAAGANAPMAEPDPDALPSWKRRPGGKGGPGGGGETAPLTLSAVKSDAGPGKDQGVSGEALKRVALGDKLGTTVGAHAVDPNQLSGPVSAGAVSGAAAGGDAAWVNRLTPDERAALQRFFK